MADLALALNVGSSSLKFRAAPMADPETGAAWGRIERIGSDGANLKISAQGATETREIPVATHEDAVRIAAEALTRALPDARVAAVGHRIVHGGPDFTRPVEIDTGVLSRLETLVPLAPLHVPAGIAGIKGAERAFDTARQIACFDTAFHAGKPWVHDAFALPQQFYDEGIRRYGFHGISCQSITRALRAEGYGVDGINLLLNDGPASNQHVPHLHLHLIPRRAGDLPALLWRSLTRFLPLGRKRLEGHFQHQAARLRHALAGDL